MGQNSLVITSTHCKHFQKVYQDAILKNPNFFLKKINHKFDLHIPVLGPTVQHVALC